MGMNYTVTLKNVSSRVKVREIAKWCDDTFGVDNWHESWAVLTSHNYDHIYRFKKEEHKNWFLLRWS